MGRWVRTDANVPVVMLQKSTNCDTRYMSGCWARGTVGRAELSTMVTMLVEGVMLEVGVLDGV